MADSRADELQSMNDNIYDNTAKEIDPSMVREVITSLIESNFNLVDDYLKDYFYSSGLTLGTKMANNVNAKAFNLLTWAYESTYTINHNLGVAPFGVVITAVCQVAEHGYTYGEVVNLASGAQNYENNSAGGISVVLNSTTSSQIIIGEQLYVIRKSDNNSRQISTGSWDLRFNFLYLG